MLLLYKLLFGFLGLITIIWFVMLTVWVVMYHLNFDNITFLYFIAIVYIITFIHSFSCTICINILKRNWSNKYA